MKKTSIHWLLTLGLALLAGCSLSSSDTGSAQLAISAPQALASSVSRVSVTASAADFPSFSVDLVFSNGIWGGTLGNIPAGSNRTFLAQAFDSSGTKLFEGSASGVSISNNQTSLVAITLQQLNAPPPFLNEAPVLDSLVASSTSTSVPVGSTLSLVATAHDPNPGDTLSYAWTSTGGSFSSATAASTSWTAPASTGIQTLTLTITDPKGLSLSVSLAFSVTPSPVQGNAQFTISFNTAPQVSALNASFVQVGVGQATSVSATASDLDGDSLTYSWSASCAGSWINASSASAQFTPAELPSSSCNNCRLTVSVSDGRGGQNTGTVALCVVTAPSSQHFNPFITSTFSSSGTASPGQVLTYEVVASDPEGSALSFSWEANTGSFGTPANAASNSHITWTAPSCAPANAAPTITATVTNGFNLTATQSFSVTGLPVCPPPGWASTGSMAVPRSLHTATLLLNGQVLIAAGYNNTDYVLQTEVYDPATGAWSVTGALGAPRYFHTATRLNSGKVLLAGGDNDSGNLATAEVYDPALGTWSATGSMVSPRDEFTATLLNNGKVLVAGGFKYGSGNLATAELYDPASGTWSTTGSMVSPRSNHTATRLLNGKVLVTGGYTDNGNLTTAEVYDPATGTWNPTAPMASPRSRSTATLLNSGKVLVAGGYYKSIDGLSAAELYDPATGTWSSTSSMASVRADFTATLLANDKVLVVGGYTGSTGLLSTAELYDPATGTWSPAASTSSPRWCHTATLLNTGKVLIAGGAGDLATAELYTP